MKIILLILCFSWSLAYQNGTARNGTLTSDKNFNETEIIEASGDAVEDNNHPDGKNVSNVPEGRVMVNMAPPDEDWVNDLQTGFLNIFSNEKKVVMSLFLCMILLAFLI